MSDDALLERPILIVGPPRSGTTLLLRLLAEHRELAFASEPRLLWRWGNDGKSDLLRPEDARPEVIRHVRAAFAREIREQGRKRLVEKTPSNALRPAFVERVFPDGQFVNILRHPVDAILSMESAWSRAQNVTGLGRRRWRDRLRELEPRQAPHYAMELVRRALPASRVVGRPVWGPRLPGMQDLLRDLSILEVCCLQWRMCAEASVHHGRSLPPERYRELRLEELTPEAVDDLVAWCGLPPDPAVGARFARSHEPGQASRHSSGADPAKRETIRRWVEPTMNWLGYGT